MTSQRFLYKFGFLWVVLTMALLSKMIYLINLTSFLFLWRLYGLYTPSLHKDMCVSNKVFAYIDWTLIFVLHCGSNSSLAFQSHRCRCFVFASYIWFNAWLSRLKRGLRFWKSNALIGIVVHRRCGVWSCVTLTGSSLPMMLIWLNYKYLFFYIFK